MEGREIRLDRWKDVDVVMRQGANNTCVRPYIKAQKNDDRDAEGIAEAATRACVQAVGGWRRKL